MNAFIATNKHFQTIDLSELPAEARLWTLDRMLFASAGQNFFCERSPQLEQTVGVNRRKTARASQLSDQGHIMWRLRHATEKAGAITPNSPPTPRSKDYE